MKSEELDKIIKKGIENINFYAGSLKIQSFAREDGYYSYSLFTSNNEHNHLLGISFYDEIVSSSNNHSLRTLANKIFFSYYSNDDTSPILRTEFTVDDSESLEIFLKEMFNLSSQIGYIRSRLKEIALNGKLPIDIWRKNCINEMLKTSLI